MQDSVSCVLKGTDYELSVSAKFDSKEVEDGCSWVPFVSGNKNAHFLHDQPLTLKECSSVINVKHLPLYKDFLLFHHLKNLVCLVFTHKFKHIQYRYFPTKWRLLRVLSYIQVSCVDFRTLDMKS
jgi:hypothetical protein